MYNFFLNTFSSFFYKAITIAFFFNFIFSNIASKDFNKCLWVKSEEMTSDQKIENLVSNAYASDYKILFFQIKIHEDFRYNPMISKKNSNLNFDPLKSALFWANWYGLEAHIWINVYKIWSSKWEPPEHHVFYEMNRMHKDWFATDINGYIDCNIKFNSSNQKVIHSDDFSGIFLSPFNNNVNNYIKDIIKKLLNDYSNLGSPLFDGIHLDYLRYKDSMYGYNYIGRKSFYNEFKIDPIYLTKSFDYSINDLSKNLKNIWNDFKSNQIDTLVKDLYQLLSEYKGLKLSAAVKPDIYESKIRWNQNWDNWIKQDYIDFVVIMNYFYDTESFSNNLWQIYKYFEDKKNIDKIYVGINTIDTNLGKNELRDLKIIKNQINNVRDFSFPAVSIFSSEYFQHSSNLYLDIFTK